MNYFTKHFKGKIGAAELLCPSWADFKTRFNGRTEHAGDQREKLFCFRAANGLGTFLELIQFVP